MSTYSELKRKLKVRKNKVFAAGVAVGVAVVGSASSASAAIDFTDVTTAIAGAVTDVLAGGAILLGAYAGYWGIKKVINMFAHG